MPIPHRIVAEISVNYIRGETPPRSMSSRFEEVIKVNAERGFDLESWKFTSSNAKDYMTETTIAVFVAVEPERTAAKLASGPV